MTQQMTIAQMTIEGYKTFPRFVFSNSIEISKFEFCHTTPIKYELVYRGKQYIYVPEGDKRSSENSGGDWTFPFEGLMLETYDCYFSWNFVKQELAIEVMDIMKQVIKEYKFGNYSKYRDADFIRYFVDYCVRNNIEVIKFLPDYKKILNDLQYSFNRAKINSALKPHYRLDENDNIVLFKTLAPKINAAKIAKYDKDIQYLRNKIAKLEQKKQLLILRQ